MQQCIFHVNISHIMSYLLIENNNVRFDIVMGSPSENGGENGEITSIGLTK